MRSEETPRFVWRPYRAGDDEGLLRLLQRTFNGWPAVETSVEPIDHLRWKIHAELKPPPYHSLVELDGRIVGAVLSFQQSFKIGDRIVAGRQGTDIAADPDFQGQGIGRLLIENGARETPGRYAFELHVGSRSRHPAMTTVRSRVYGTSMAFAHGVDVLVAPLSGAPVQATTASTYAIADAGGFDGRIGGLLEAASQQFDFMIARAQDYLNWRYADPRGGRYRIRVAEEDGRLLGYAVLTSMRRHGYVADLLTLPGREDVAEALLRDGLALLRETSLESLRCWAPHGHPYLGALRGAGFTRSREPRHMTYRAYREPEEAMFLSGPNARLHVMAGDSDSV